MSADTSTTISRRGTAFAVVVIAATVITGAVVAQRITIDPRTDDAEVFANYIGVAPLVSGPVQHLYVSDNQQLAAGQPMFDIDDRPYAYALEQARSSQQALQGDIHDERRIIASKESGVLVARAGEAGSHAAAERATAVIRQAEADVVNAKAAVERADAEAAYASSNLKRLEPLLSEQFVTADQIDQARTLQTTRSQAAQQARSQLAQAEAGLKVAQAQYSQQQANVELSHHQVSQASHSVTTLEPLLGRLPGTQASIETAQYNYDHTHVVAPFAARVTNLTISEGQFVDRGQRIFTLIDTRTWWVIANFRETQLQHIRPGMQADVYVLSLPNVRLRGTVESVGFGVKPDADLVGTLTPTDIPDVQRNLNWVHLASRFPIRIRIQSAPSEILRLGESAVVTIRGKSISGSGY